MTQPAPDRARTSVHRRADRLGDDHYCAPCGWLFCSATDAHQHRREVHPEQARYEQTRDDTLVEAAADAH